MDVLNIKLSGGSWNKWSRRNIKIYFKNIIIKKTKFLVYNLYIIVKSVKDDNLLKINENICFPNVISINASNKDSGSK